MTTPQAAAQYGPKHQQILDAACACFGEQGFASTRISDIARRAGIGKGTIYEYVRSKEELLLDACLHACSREEQAMNQLAGGHPIVASDGRPVTSSDLHPVRASYEVLRSVLSVLLMQSSAQHRMFSELQTACFTRPDLMASTRQRFGSKLAAWMETAFQLGQRGMASGFFRPMDSDEYRWCARLIVAAVDGLIWQRSFIAEDDAQITAHNIAAAWLRLHLHEPQRLSEFLAEDSQDPRPRTQP